MWLSEHPAFKRNRRQYLKSLPSVDILDRLEGPTRDYQDFKNPLHPQLYLFPCDQHMKIVDDWKEPIALNFPALPYSSNYFWVDFEECKGVWREIWRSPAFLRLAWIRQLGHLVPDVIREKHWEKLYFLLPAFKHSRWEHSILVGAMAEVILARMGFSEEDRDPIVLAFAAHDIAMPAGGDSVIRVDKNNLSEERNFSWQLKQFGLDERWKELFGFNLGEAQGWVLGEGVFGQLLDFLDRISYTGLDCFFIIHNTPAEAKRLRRFTQENPLVMDVWEDIRLEKGMIYFSNPKRLYKFLMLRLLEWLELLRNPACRPLDILIFKEVEVLYRKGVLDKKKLLFMRDEDLFEILERENDQGLGLIKTPDDYGWQKFRDLEEAETFSRRLGDKQYFIEHIKPIKPGLNWPVLHQGKVTPIRAALSKNELAHLEQLSKTISGTYVYFYK